MTVTAVSFRTDYPEFSDPSKYPDPWITFYIAQAGMMLNAVAWGTALDMGTELYVAHFVSLRKKQVDADSKGGNPGDASPGPVASKGVGPVNVSFDTQAGIEEGAGHWNLTTYGKEFIRTSRMFGAGGAQVR